MTTITGTDYHADIDVHGSVQKAFDTICRCQPGGPKTRKAVR